MILPTKRLGEDRALIAVGAIALRHLNEPKTVSRLWEEVRQAREQMSDHHTITYDWFILALDLLYTLQAIDFDKGRLVRAQL